MVVLVVAATVAGYPREKARDGNWTEPEAGFGQSQVPRDDSLLPNQKRIPVFLTTAAGTGDHGQLVRQVRAELGEARRLEVGAEGAVHQAQAQQAHDGKARRTVFGVVFRQDFQACTAQSFDSVLERIGRSTTSLGPLAGAQPLLRARKKRLP